jgi:hypothetical protein
VERIVVNRSATLYKTFYVDGAAADPTGAPTVTVTRLSDGTTVTTGAVTDEAAAGTWSVTIPATANTLLDTLTLDWAATVNGVSQEHVDLVEVAGGTFFTISELRARLTSGTYTDAEIVDMRTTVEQEMEQACSCAFVPRYAHETVSGPGGRSLMLRPLVQRVRSATIDGTAISASDITGLSYGITGTVYSSSVAWSQGTSNIVVGYEHGFQEPPAGVKRAALILAKMWLVGQRSPIDDRAATYSATEGGTYSLVVPGRNGSTFGQPDVDAVIDRYDLSVGIA